MTLNVKKNRHDRFQLYLYTYDVGLLKIIKGINKVKLIGKFILFACCLVTPHTYAKDASELISQPGLWEGVNHENQNFKLLKFNENGKHFLFSLRMISGLQEFQKIPFSTKDVQCTSSECSINFPYSKRYKASKRLILTPHTISGFHVIEMERDENKNVIFSTTYQLQPQKNQSTAHNFLDKFHHRLAEFKKYDNTDEGLWIGTAFVNNTYRLLILELYRDKKTTLFEYFNGSNDVLTEDFEPENSEFVNNNINLIIQDGRVLKTLNLYNSNNFMLQGYFISTIDNELLRNVKIELYKLKLK